MQGNSGIAYAPYYRDLKAAAAFGLTEDAWSKLPRDARITCVAMYEIEWRVAALQQWEREEEAKRKPKNKKR